MRRVKVREILADPVRRRQLLAATIQATQAREGIDTTLEQAEQAYDAVQQERILQTRTTLPKSRPLKRTH